MKIFVAVAFLLAGCASQPCFTPPPTSSSQQKEIMVKLAAQFSAIPVSPSIETDFKNQVNVTYAALSDDNQAYWMAANLALCFSEKGKWGQAVAARILLDLEAQWMAKKGTTSAADHPQAAAITQIHQAVGLPK